LVPFPALFLIYFFYLHSTIFYKIHPHQIFFAGVILQALSKSSALGFLLKFSEGGVPGGGIEPGTAP
jgi:hypothetical protein